MEYMSVIAITMQYGSGGREVGTQLAEKLRLPLYDDRIAEEAARHSGLSRRLFDTTEFLDDGLVSRFSDIFFPYPVLGWDWVI